MAPSYCSGDYVIAYRRRHTPFHPGDVIVLHHAHFGDIIKRITGFDDAGHLLIRGDNPSASTDSGALGPIARDQVQGKVIARIANPQTPPTRAYGQRQ